MTTGPEPMISTDLGRASPSFWPGSARTGLAGVRRLSMASLEEMAMAGSIVYLDRSAIISDDLEGLRRAIHDLVGFVGDREPQLVVYGFEIDEPNRRMTVVAV